MTTQGECFILKTIVLVSLVIVLPLQCYADVPSGIGKDKYNFSIGSFLPAVNTEMRLDSGTLGRGTTIDLEDDLGFDAHQNTGRLDAYIRFAPRHRLNVGYFNMNRTASGVIDKTIQFGDQVFAINTNLDSEFKTSIILTNYMYSIVQQPKFELAVAIGVHYSETKTSLSTSGGAISVNAKADGPLPLVGLDIKYAVKPNLHLGLLAQWFKADTSDYDGTIRNINASIEYFVQKNFGIGIGYSQFKVDYNTNMTFFKGAIRYSYGGPQIFASLRF